MSFTVRSSKFHAYRCATQGGMIQFMDYPGDEWVALTCARRLIDEKGYPENTEVVIDGNDPMAMVLITESDGSWELV